MDTIDIGSELAEKHTAINIENVRKLAAKGGLPFIGECYNPKCGAELDDRNFCDAKCRDEYDRLTRNQNRR